LLTFGVDLNDRSVETKHHSFEDLIPPRFSGDGELYSLPDRSGEMLGATEFPVYTRTRYLDEPITREKFVYVLKVRDTFTNPHTILDPDTLEVRSVSVWSPDKDLKRSPTTRGRFEIKKLQSRLAHDRLDHPPQGLALRSDV